MMRTAVRARWLAAITLVAIAAWGFRVAWPTGELRDYGSFVASGRAASQGEDAYGIHPLTFHVVLPGFETWNPNLNPPISIPVFQLFDLVDPKRGFVAWWWLSMASYLVAVMLLIRRYGAGPSGLLALWAVALAGFWDTLALGQIYLPLVLAGVAAWLLLERGRAAAAGVLLGLVVAVKPNFCVWPALLLLAGHHRAPLVAGVTTMALWAIPLAAYGTGIYARWFELISSDKGRAGFLTNASLPGLAERAGLAPVGLLASAAILAALAWLAFRRRPAVMHASALGLAGAILASPLAWVHYTLFLLPVFFASARPMTLMLGTAAALLTVPVPLVLRLTDASVLLQVSVGSVYTWAVLLCLAHVVRGPRPVMTCTAPRATRIDPSDALGANA